MSRSRRHTPIMGFTTARSEKKDKELYNRSLRHKTKESLKLGKDDLPTKRDVSDTWNMAKDGKQIFDPDLDDGKWMRK